MLATDGMTAATARGGLLQATPPLVVQIGAPPSGYRYVRAANDILLIAIGTGMVVDAIQDLGGK
jgi:hypothetical protein